MATTGDFASFIGQTPPPGAMGAVCPRCGTPARISDWLVMRSGCECCGAHDELTCPHCFAASDGVHDKWPAMLFVGADATFPELPD